MAVFALASKFLGDSIASLEIEMLSGLGKNCLCLQGESLVHILQIDKRREGGDAVRNLHCAALEQP